MTTTELIKSSDFLIALAHKFAQHLLLLTHFELNHRMQLSKNHLFLN